MKLKYSIDGMQVIVIYLIYVLFRINANNRFISTIIKAENLLNGLHRALTV